MQYLERKVHGIIKHINDSEYCECEMKHLALDIGKAALTNIMKIRERCYWQVRDAGPKGDAHGDLLVSQTLKRHR